MKKYLIPVFCSVCFFSNGQSLDFQLKKSQTLPFLKKETFKQNFLALVGDSTKQAYSSNMPIKTVEGVMPNMLIKTQDLMPNPIAKKEEE